MLSMNSIMIGTKHSMRCRPSTKRFLAKRQIWSTRRTVFAGWQVGTGYVGVLKHSGMDGNTKDPGRVMLNYETTQVQEEFDRIKALGGTVIAAPYKMGEGWIATLADPDGNYFQLMNPIQM